MLMLGSGMPGIGILGNGSVTWMFRLSNNVMSGSGGRLGMLMLGSGIPGIGILGIGSLILSPGMETFGSGGRSGMLMLGRGIPGIGILGIGNVGIAHFEAISSTSLPS